MKTTIILLIGLLLLGTIIFYAGYIKATSFICVEETPAVYLVGSSDNLTSTIKCDGGFLMKLNPNFPIN